MPIVIKQAESPISFNIENAKKYTSQEIKNIFINLDQEKAINIEKNKYVAFKGHILSTNENLNKFTKMINHILKNAPTFDLKTFLEDEILLLAEKAWNDSKFDYDSTFFKTLELKISEAEQSFKTKITNILKQKAIVIAEKFGINNPEKKLPKLFYNLKRLDDPLFDKSDINTIFKKISNEMEKDGLQIPGLSGVYDPLIFNKKMDISLNKLGVCLPNSNQNDSSITEQTDSLGKYIITYIAGYYKNKTDNLATPATIELKYIEMNKTDKTTNRLNLLEKLIPGTKVLLNPLLNHNDDKYGSLVIDINEKNDKQLADVTVIWNYGGINTIVYNRNNIKVVDTKTPVETAYDLLNRYYVGDNLLPSTNFEIPSLINAFGTDFDTLINSLSKKSWNEITKDELRKLAKNAMIVNPKSKIAEKINNLLLRIAEIQKHINVDIKVEYSSPDYSMQLLKFRLYIVEREAKTALPEEKSFDLVPSGTNDTTPLVNTMSFLYPNQIIGKIIDDSKKPMPPEQDFINHHNGNPFNDEYFFNELEFGKKIKTGLERWKKYKYNNVKITNSVSKNDDPKALKNNYILNVTIEDKNMTLNPKTNEHRKRNHSYIFQAKSIEEQLKPLWDELLKFGGKRDSIFDPARYPDPENPTAGFAFTQDSLSGILLHFDGTTTLNDVIEKKLPNGAKIKYSFIRVLNATYPPGERERGLGLTWTINLKQQDIFGNNAVSMSSDITNSYVYEYNKLKPGDIEDAKNDVKKVRDTSVAIAKTKLTSNQEIDDKINAKIMEMNDIYNEFIKNIDNMEQKLELSKVLLHNMKQEAIKKIMEKLESITHFKINTLKTVKEINKIMDYKLTPEQIMIINKYPELFRELLKITKKKDVYERLLNDPTLLKNLNKYIGSDIFQKSLDALIKTENYYKYAYFGVGVASGIAGLGAGALSLSSMNAKRKLAKMNTKKVKIRGGKAVAWITTLIALSAIAISIATQLWFFIAQGGF